MTGVLEHRSCSADWISPQPQTFQTYREALRLSTEADNFFDYRRWIVCGNPPCNLNFLALGGTSLAICPRSTRVAEKNTLCCCPNLKDLLIELPRVTLGKSLADSDAGITAQLQALAAPLGVLARI